MEVLVGTTRVPLDSSSGTVGQVADRLAADHQVAGLAFSIKAAGSVADRSSKVSALPAVGLLELVEVTEPSNDPKPARTRAARTDPTK